MKEDPAVSSVIASFRKYMNRLGFISVSLVSVPDYDDHWCVSAYDPMNERLPFCRVYSVDDMRSIMHVGDIFWRYIK